MKPALILTLCLVTVLRAGEPLPGNPAEHGVPGTFAPAEAGGQTPGRQPATTGNTGSADPQPAARGLEPVTAAGDSAPAAPAAPAATAVPAQLQGSPILARQDASLAGSTGTNNEPSPDAIELPKITVKPKPRPRLTPALVITKKGFEDKATSLDGKLLNKLALPGWMGRMTAAERAREEQRLAEKQELVQDVNTIAKAVEVMDPAQAKALRDAVSKP